jgi:hypothetical protein
MTARTLASVVAALTRGVFGAASAQAVPDEACPRPAVMVAGFAACDSDRAADELPAAGFWNVAIIAGGIDRSVAEDGSVEPGRRTLGPPWHVPPAAELQARLR